MPAAVLPKSKWEEIRLASIAGVPDDRLASEYGVTKAAIRQKRKRGLWPTENRAELEKEKARESLNNGRSTMRRLSKEIETEEDELSQSVSVAALIGKTKEEIGELTGMEVLKALSPQVISAVTEEAESFRPQNLKQLAAAFSIISKASGLDKPQTAVQVNLGFSSKSSSQHWLDSSQVVEIEDDE